MSSARPLWYKDAIIYELKVRSFFDSDADGFGDFQGLTHKLDYLQDLGVTTLWLLPFYPSPLRDDGYDIADYMTVHPETGTIEDFVIIDFDGEPGRSPADRRRKRSPLADVAGMLRSLHYAAQGVLLAELPGSPTRRKDVPFLELWADYWYAWVGNAFVGGYLEPLQASPLLPVDPVKLATLLEVHLLEKALYELSYELNNRPSWVGIPLRGILSVLGTETPT